MRNSLVWRIALTLCVLLAAAACLLPALWYRGGPVDPAAGPPRGLRFLPDTRITLGLDLKGGIQLTLGVEVDKALAASLGQTGQAIMREAAEKGLLMSRPRPAAGDRIEFILASPGKQPDLEELLTRYDQIRIVSAQAQADGRIRYLLEFTAEARIAMADMTVEQALTTIRSRIDQFGVVEPDIRRQQGENRISIQLPGLEDPQRAMEIIGKTAHLEFRLVRDDLDPKARILPPDVIVLPMDETGRGGKSSGDLVALENQVALTGEYITNAVPRYDSSDGSLAVSVSFDRQGSAIFGALTRDNVGRYLAIILDGKVYSTPVIKQEIIGDASITGGFTPEEANDLALVLRAGSLPAPVTVLEERTVGPSLGQESIDKGIMAATAGGIVVVLFMLAYYGFSGLIADAMLFLDIVFIFAGMALFGATLTLPGIAGIVLTLGMAVDANVLIFERIREEIHKGFTPRAAVDAGFSRAMVAIVDSNLTTIVAAAILYQFGTGPVRGFAVTLVLGIVASMFTAVFVSRTIFDLWMGKPGRKLSI
ncbi:MAG: protein translocase subunit SecD [Desulfovibrio sp.]|jgi:preprotein translocase subunit SecD|nr:protein translocase subunit SecD [Desulfovibrio sp.]